jgi:predicted GNAT family acetyltransferase
MTSKSVAVHVTHRVNLNRFEIREDKHIAFLRYKREGARVIMDHTYVPDELRGRGLANALVNAALEEARPQGWTIVPKCSFVAGIIERNSKFADLVERL